MLDENRRTDRQAGHTNRKKKEFEHPNSLWPSEWQMACLNDRIVTRELHNPVCTSETERHTGYPFDYNLQHAAQDYGQHT